MSRLVKRYGNRKLYDPSESRYVSLAEMAGWIADGEQVEVVDNGTGEDVTVQVLTQLISEQGRRGRTFPSTLLHDLIRTGEDALAAGEEAVSARVRRLQETAGHVAGAVQKRVDLLKQPAALEHQLAQLRERMEALEAQLERLTPPPPNPPQS
jgi:polyhydroxyalkanoate synthesis repressor PhaR